MPKTKKHRKHRKYKKRYRTGGTKKNDNQILKTYSITKDV